MAPLRVPMRVFNKMSREARVTVPKLSPSAYSCEKTPFYLDARLKITYFCVRFCHGMAFGKQGFTELETVVSINQVFIGRASQDIKVYCSQQRWLFETWALCRLYFPYLHTTDT